MLSLLAPPLAAAPLGSIREVFALTAEEAAKKKEVRLEVTLLLDDRQRSTFFVHDGSDCCYALIPDSLYNEGLKQGQRHRVEAFTTPGDYRAGIEVVSMTPLGPGAEPKPLRLTGGDLFQTHADAQWVEVEGRVEGSSFREGGPSLDISVQGWVIHAFLPRDSSSGSILPWHLLGRNVRVRGIAAGTFNDERQMTRRFMFVPSLQHVVPVGDAVAAAALPAAATSLLTLGSELSARVRVRGTVTHQIEGEALYL
jgi:hypothetical protein